MTKRGRRPLPAEQKLIEVRVYLLPDVVANLLKVGSGDAKAGIEKLIRGGPATVDAATGPGTGSAVDDPKPL